MCLMKQMNERMNECQYFVKKQEKKKEGTYVYLRMIHVAE